MTTTNKDFRVSLGQERGRSEEPSSKLILGERPMTGFRTARSTLGVLAAAATLAMGCAGELDGNPEEYVKAWGNPGQGGSTAGGSAGVAGGVAGTPAGGSNTAGTSPGGAPAGGTGGGMIPPDPPCVATVFSGHGCTSCHGGGSTIIELIGGGLDLSGSNLGARLSKTAALYKTQKNVANCKQGALIIDPAMPTQSILLKKVTNTQDCGDPMPQASASNPGGLMGADLQCIQDWIMSFGASANMVSFGDNGGGSGGDNL